MRTANPSLPIVSLLFLAAAGAGATLDPGGWNDTRWGMGRDEVKRMYPEARILKNTLSLFHHRVIDKRADLTFFFTPEDRLAMVGIDFSRAEEGDAGLVDAFEEIRGLLIKKYGPEARPTQQIGHTHILDQKGPDALEKEIAIGHMSFLSTWEFDTTTIELFLTGEESRIKLVLFYSSKRFGDHYENPWEEEKLGDL